MDISPLTAGAAAAAQKADTASTGMISSDFETFLKMLTVQMQNQDPLNPIKSEDYAVQLATFSGVEQQVRTNDLIAGMAAQIGLLGMSQMAGWVGMEARAPVPAYFDGTPISLVPQPAQTADRADLVVRDQSGRTVQRLAIPVGGGSLDWAGVTDAGAPFAAGIYSFEVESFGNGAVIASAPVELYGSVAEAQLRGGETILVMRGGVEVPAAQVTALRDPSLAA